MQPKSIFDYIYIFSKNLYYLSVSHCTSKVRAWLRWIVNLLLIKYLIPFFLHSDDFSMCEKRPYQTFNLPKDELLQSKWLYNLNRPKTYTNPETGNLVKIKHKNLAVCIRHFRCDDFEQTTLDKEKGRIRFGIITCQQ